MQWCRYQAVIRVPLSLAYSHALRPAAPSTANIPTVTDLTTHLRQNLVRRLDSYQANHAYVGYVHTPRAQALSSLLPLLCVVVWSCVTSQLCVRRGLQRDCLGSNPCHPAPRHGRSGTGEGTHSLPKLCTLSQAFLLCTSHSIASPSLLSTDSHQAHLL